MVMTDMAPDSIRKKGDERKLIGRPSVPAFGGAAGRAAATAEAPLCW
jgi:hypothetical protein